MAGQGERANRRPQIGNNEQLYGTGVGSIPIQLI